MHDNLLWKQNMRILSEKQKRLYTRGTLRSIKIVRLAKIQTFIVIGWDYWFKKRVAYLSCTEEKGDLEDIHRSAQNAALFVDLL